MSRKITLRALAEARFDPPPSRKTLQRWARDCWIYPVPEKLGREYRVDPEARFIGSDHENILGSEAA